MLGFALGWFGWLWYGMRALQLHECIQLFLFIILFYDYMIIYVCFYVFHICFYKIIFYYDIIDITYYRYGGNNKILFELS
jgi:hypothetical protein